MKACLGRLYTRPPLWAGLSGPGPPYRTSLPIQIKYRNIYHLFDRDTGRQKVASISVKATERAKHRPAVSVYVDYVYQIHWLHSGALFRYAFSGDLP